MENETWVAIGGTGIVSSITAFLIGKSGIVRKWFDNRLSRVEMQQKREESEVEKTKQENVELHKLVDQLTLKVSVLERELATTNLRLEVLLAYFQKTQPDTDTFIEELKKSMKKE